jgi:hypothetical protein
MPSAAISAKTVNPLDIGNAQYTTGMVTADAGPPRERTAARARWSRWAIITGAALVFAAYAACFLYFFVDDEAIPLVYARNLLRGHGLIYNLAEGRVEGYSDFLHVLWQGLVIEFSRAAGLSRLAPLDIGKAVSFLFGIGILVLTGDFMQRAGVRRAGMVAGLGFLALAGPLAVWSCSSLEAVPFAFFILALVRILAGQNSGAHTTAAVVFGGVALLQRIDGFVYVGSVLVAALLMTEPALRRAVLLRVVLPIVAIGVLYHAARFAYYGTLVSAPLEAKVLYKFAGAPHAVVKAPDQSYLRGFLDLYGMAVVPALVVAAIGAWRSRSARVALVAGVLIGTYAALVGDWMFGWRFFVPVLPLTAAVIAAAVSRMRDRLAWPAAAIVLIWSVLGAQAFAREYVAVEKRPIWWTSPHGGEAVWLAPYDDLLTTARRAITRGETIAYNQAGLLPFVLDVVNIDDLGVCSKFEAGLPTTDVYFTEVGRYSPLTDAPILNAAHAYLLYRDVRMLISRTDLLEKANDGHIPPELLDGYFRLAAVDASRQNALYARTEKDARGFRRDPSLFRQDLLHSSRIRRVDVDGRRLTDAEVGPALPYLRWQTGSVRVRGRTRIDILFADHDEDVYALYAAALSARGGAVALMLSLYDESGHRVAHEHAQPDESPAPLWRRFDRPVRARLLSIEAFAADGDADLVISDLRADGQSAALRDYVRTNLRFQ